MASSKSAWKRVRFADMVTSAGATRKARGWTAGAAGVDRYVGLEHLDTNSPKIRRWASPETVGENSDLRHFEAGDVILARRGIEQRKVGAADFRGVASGHALVFRAQPGVVLPAFLPYFLLSDVFMNRALEFSAGSLSKTVNLSALMKQEFAVPAVEEQARLAPMFSAADLAWQSLGAATAAAAIAATAFIEGFIAHSKSFVPIGNVISDISYGCSMKSSTRQAGLPILRIPNVLRGDLDLSELMWVELDGTDRDRYSVRKGDVLLVRTNGNPSYVGRSVHVSNDIGEMAYASYLLRLRVRETQIRPAFLSAMINAPTTRRGLRGSVQSSAGNYNINTVGVRSQVVPSSSLTVQDELLERLQSLQEAEARLEKRSQAAMNLCRALVEWGISP